SCRTVLAATNKCLAQSNKTRTQGKATEKRSNPATRSIRVPHYRNPANNNRETNLMEFGAKPAFTAMAYRHPADEIADIRDESAALKNRESEKPLQRSPRRDGSREGASALSKSWAGGIGAWTI